MGKEVASPYACLTIGFLEETILFPTLIPSSFEHVLAQRIIEAFFRFVDDGINPLPRAVDPTNFVSILNSMDPSIQYTISEPTETIIEDENMEYNDFLSLRVFTTSSGNILTDIHYKETNTHEYLHYDSHHPSHVKNNIPYSLAKTIIVSTTRPTIMENNLLDLTVWLQKCGYPKKIIDKGIFNARLQGPANDPLRKKDVIPFISTFYSNYDSNNIIEVAKNLIENSKNQRIQQVFENVQFIHSIRQPPNILRQITNASFITGNYEKREAGIFRCKRSNCKVCAMYLQECKSFHTMKCLWTVKCYADCHSINAIYYQLCNFCSAESNLGKTDDIRERTNNHISCSRLGTGDHRFDRHCYECPRKQGIVPKEPYFKLYIMMVLNDYHKLRSVERNLHLQNHDTINATHSSET